MSISKNKEELLQLLSQREMEIAVLKEKINRIEKHIGMDDLMDIYNKRRGISQLRVEMDKALRIREPLTLCFIDIDDLKKINDTLGHLQGDVVLVAISNLIKECVRKTDTVFRYGGDEIVIILPNTTLKAAEKICIRLDKSLQNLNIPNMSFKLSISKGLVEFDFNKDLMPSELIKEADKNMYKEKLKKKAINRNYDLQLLYGSR